MPVLDDVIENVVTETAQDGFEVIEGITYRNDQGKIISNPDRKLIEDLNSLPKTSRKYIDMEVYKKTNSVALPFAKSTPVATIMTSRGCPYDCIFCSTKVMWRKDWRSPEMDHIISEIEDLVHNYGIKEIAIMDDQFVMKKERIKDFCDCLEERNLNITLSVPSGTSIWLVDFELLKRMKEVGFYRLCFPVETGCQKTLDFIQKPVKLDKVKETIRFTTQLGFWTQGNFIIGFPYETPEEIEETIRYAYDSGLDYAFFFVAKPYAGSEMYEVAKEEGLVPNIIRASHIQQSDYDTTTLKAAELNEIHRKAVGGFLVHKLKFYLTPKNFVNYLLPKLKSFSDIKYACKIVYALIMNKVLPLLKFD